MPEQKTYTQAQGRATQKYIKNNYDEIKIRIPKGEKAIIKDFAMSKGESLNSFVKQAIEERIAKG